jgi:hypothetical protein
VVLVVVQPAEHQRPLPSGLPAGTPHNMDLVVGLAVRFLLTTPGVPGVMVVDR